MTEESTVTTRLRVGVRLKVIVKVFVGDWSLLAVDDAVNVTVCDGSDEERDVRDLVNVSLLLSVSVFDVVDVNVCVWVGSEVFVPPDQERVGDRTVTVKERVSDAVPLLIVFVSSTVSDALDEFFVAVL